ncbi:MAG: hypothetical protein Ct9H300mP20_16770 [Gammaproteobacteria bacterium]|nr:MAG: hypothetical protein Ct9H300mP20_16770 [Gammaproteobacteria bacterium]
MCLSAKGDLLLSDFKIDVIKIGALGERQNS